MDNAPVHAEIHARHITSTPAEAAYEQRAAELSIWTGGRLVVAIATFVYASLAFAYFYLRSSNNEDLWRPGGVTAPTALGATIFALVGASALLNSFGVRRMRAGYSMDWIVAGWLAVLGGLIAIGVQVFELTRLPFFPGSSGYASCFVGWAALNIAALLIATYWLETVLARGLRLRGELNHDLDAETPEDATHAVRLFRNNLESCSYFWIYLGGVSLLFWLLFYVL
jgi:heme/copper-type cytochrome/quinol oxidase subunit 3